MDLRTFRQEAAIAGQCYETHLHCENCGTTFFSPNAIQEAYNEHWHIFYGSGLDEGKQWLLCWACEDIYDPDDWADYEVEDDNG